MYTFIKNMHIIYKKYVLEVIIIQSLDEGKYSGIDVSNWQGTIDFSQVKNSGVQVVYMKATEGNYYTDTSLNINYTGAKGNSLLVGFYHFFRANIDPKEQAKYFINSISGKTSDCRLALDIETTQGYGPDELTSRCIDFLEEVKRLSGLDVVVYTYTSFAKNNLTSSISQYPLWIAHYGVTTPGYNGVWDSWIGFQYSDSGSIPGVNGKCDLDKFMEEILLSCTETIPGSRPSEPESSNSNNGTYTVQAGDTLSGIAQKYGTTWQSLAQLNNISNPNVIYPGEVLKVSGGSSNSNSTAVGGTYTVQMGDTLSGIAQKYGTTWQNLAQINNISDPNVIYPGQVLKISGGSSNSNSATVGETYTVQTGDTLSGIAQKYGTTWQSLAQINNISNPNKIYPGQVLKIN